MSNHIDRVKAYERDQHNRRQDFLSRMEEKLATKQSIAHQDRY